MDYASLEKILDNKFGSYVNMFDETQKQELYNTILKNKNIDSLEQNDEFISLLAKDIREYFDKRITYIEPNEEKGFSCGYAIYIPDGCDKDTTIMVYSTNTGHAKNTLDEAILDVKAKNVMNDAIKEIATLSKTPLLIPLIPRVKGYDTHMLTSYVMNNDFDSINKNGGNFTKEELDSIKEKLNNIPDQLVNMIKDSKKVLKSKNINVDDQVIMYGYSAGSKFANRFTNMHPELVKGLVIGGTTGIEELDKLNIPVFVGNGGKDINNPFEIVGNDVKYKETGTYEEAKNIESKYGSFEGRFQRRKEQFRNRENIEYNIYKDYGHELESKKEFIKDASSFVNNKIKKQNLNQDKKLNVQVKEKKSFSKRSQSEIKIASQIRTKNKVVAKIKNTKKQMNKPESLSHTNMTNHYGYINIVILSLIAIIIVMIIYILVIK